MTTVVTGGAGFIGSNLVDALLARGDRVVVVDDLSTGRRANLEDGPGAAAELHEIDVRDAGALAALIAETAPTCLFHLAAQIDVRRSVADPAADARINVEGTVNALEAARRAGVGRFVLVSTGGALYGAADTIPTPEGAPIRPQSPYGTSKYAAEGYCELYERLHGLSTVVLRLANVYGPRQDPLGEAGVVAIFCGCAQAGERPTVYGDGLQTRDFVYVGDVVAAILTAADADIAGAFNVGTGSETSVLDLAGALAPLAAGDFTPRHEPARSGEARRSCLDASLIERGLGWRAGTRLGDGLARTLAAAAPA